MAKVKDSVAMAAVAIKSVILVFIEVEVRVGVEFDYGLGSEPLPPPLYDEGVMFSSVQDVTAIEVVMAKAMMIISFFMWWVFRMFTCNLNGLLFWIRTASTAIHYCTRSYFFFSACRECH